MAELHERFAEADERWGSQYTPRLAAQARLDAIKNRREALAARLKLGYAQLDAGCKAEAKKTFEGVWAWNGSDYADFGAQAREALNALRAGG